LGGPVTMLEPDELASVTESETFLTSVGDGRPNVPVDKVEDWNALPICDEKEGDDEGEGEKSDSAIGNDIKELSRAPGKFFTLLKTSAAGAMFGTDIISDTNLSDEKALVTTKKKKSVFGSCADPNVSFQTVAAASRTSECASDGLDVDHSLEPLFPRLESVDATSFDSDGTAPGLQAKPIYFGSAGKAPNTVYFGTAAAEHRRNMFEAGLSIDPKGPILKPSSPVYSQFRFTQSNSNSDSDSDSTSSADDDVPRHYTLLGRQTAVALSTRSLDRSGPTPTFHFGTASDEASTLSEGCSSGSTRSASSQSIHLITPKAAPSERKPSSV
jgi:hypothetical protein